MSSTDPRFGVAVVGAGLMGRWHVHAARRAGARVVAIADRDPAAAERLARSCGARAYDDLARLLAEASPRAVHLCTPLDTHEDLACRALAAGAHLLVEKPLAATASGTRAVLERADRGGLLAVPVHQFAFQRGVRDAKAALPSLGEALRFDFRIASAGGERLGEAQKDALVADILPHPFSVLQALWPGEPSDPGDWSAWHPAPGELEARGRWGGVAVGITVSLAARPPCCQADISARHGRVHLDFFHGYAVVSRGEATRAGKAARPFLDAAGTALAAGANLARRAMESEPAYPGLNALVARFIAAARGEEAAPISPAAALEVAVLRDRLVAAAGLLPAP